VALEAVSEKFGLVETFNPTPVGKFSVNLKE
jgi:hypothetical protein